MPSAAKTWSKVSRSSGDGRRGRGDVGGFTARGGVGGFTVRGGDGGFIVRGGDGGFIVRGGDDSFIVRAAAHSSMQRRSVSERFTPSRRARSLSTERCLSANRMATSVPFGSFVGLPPGISYVIHKCIGDCKRRHAVLSRPMARESDAVLLGRASSWSYVIHILPPLMPSLTAWASWRSSFLGFSPGLSPMSSLRLLSFSSGSSFLGW